MEPVTVTVSVPKSDVPKLMQFAASLWTSVASEAAAEDDELSDAGRRMPWGWGAAAVQRAYLGGVSEHWRPFLEFLAEHAGQWVDWPDVLAAIDMGASQAAGMLGAAERRCKGRPPYEKQWRNGVRQFRMDPRVAHVIEEVRDRR